MGFTRLGQTLTAHDVLSLVKDDLRKVEEAIHLESIASVPSAAEIGRYMNTNGGKRLRPILVLLSCRLFREPTESAIRMAAVVEMIHTATLVHDDIIDAAETRRGKASTNILWGNQRSVLAGDWLYMQAFQAALRERNFHILDVLIALTQLMVEGELIQLERIGKADISEADYMELVDRKTASLFSACARLGAVAGGAAEALEHKLAEYAWNLGIAFQLVDDILDFTARETVLGKPVGNDLREGKVTLPVIYALEDASADEKAAISAVVRERAYTSAPFGKILAILERHGAIERARERANSFAAKARNLMLDFPESPYQRALATVTEMVIDRDH